MSPSNKTVLITGATRGIGLELVKQYKADGWSVIAAARSLNNAEQLQALAPFKIVQIDTGDEASILQAAKELDGEAIDLLINNAGVGIYEDFESTTKESMLRQFEVNTIGPFLVTRAFVSNLEAAAAINGSASVVQMSSYAGSIARNDGVAFGTGNYGYRTAKAGLNMMNSCLALDLKKHNIIAISLHPGYVRTDMTKHEGLVETDESVAAMIKVIQNLQLEDTGKFLSFKGTTMPW